MKTFKTSHIAYDTEGNAYGPNDKILHGLYIIDGSQEGYWEGKKLDLSYPSFEEVDIHGFPKVVYACDEIVCDLRDGIYVEYNDQDGEAIGYYDFIEEDFKLF